MRSATTRQGPSDRFARKYRMGRPIDIDAYHQFTREMPISIHWPVVHRIRHLRGGGLKDTLFEDARKLRRAVEARRAR